LDAACLDRPGPAFLCFQKANAFKHANAAQIIPKIEIQIRIDVYGYFYE
jgi:hypothetical protein